MAKYHMQKKEREITDRQILMEIIRQGKFTIISMCRDDEPYLVTMNYGFDQDNRALYFHSAQKGLKFDFINRNPRVCATVIEDKGYRLNECEHGYRSVVFWGKMAIVESLKEKKQGMDVLLNHLEENPDPIKKRLLQDDAAYENVGILRLDIQEITGKEAH